MVIRYDFLGKTAVVTGALGAIGSAIARRFLESGANVVLSDILPDAGGIEEYQQYGERYIYVPCDISDRAQCLTLCEAAVRKYGGVDILVNNAGINGGEDKRVTVEEYDDTTWDKIVKTDLNGVYNCSKPVIHDMVTHGGGKIVNIGSVVGYVPLRLQCAFAAAKAGVHNLTRAMAIELAEKGICVNAVLPGSTMSTGTAQLFYRNKEKNESLMAHIPMHRPARPEEIASAVLFLCDEESSYITGDLLIVDGGWSCGYSRDW